MIITTITSGFGNQLFQYAAGYALAKKRHAKLRLDTRFYQENKYRNYELGRLGISAQELSWADKARLDLLDASMRRRSIKWPLHFLPLLKLRYVDDAVSGFDNSVLEQPNGTVLRGYWQNEEYFSEYREDILREFTFRSAPDAENAAMISRIKEQTSICVHVRRGDYLSSKEVVAAAPIRYYENAVKWMTDRVPNAKYFVFSDEPDWCRENLGIADPVFVTHNTGKNDPEDLRLMTHCDHFIIANSTFSWWGAWLSTAPHKQVIAPQQWFSVPNGNELAIVPRDWLRL